MKTNKNLLKVVLAALFAALIFVLTFFVKIPTAIGYIHLGDLAIYLAASLLPTPYAMAAAGIGAGMADLVGGYGVYVPVTMVVKMLLALCFTSKGEKVLNVRNLVAVFICCGITVFGYFAFKIFYYGAAAYASMIPNLIQAGASGILYLVVGAAFNKSNIKSKVAL